MTAAHLFADESIQGERPSGRDDLLPVIKELLLRHKAVLETGAYSALSFCLSDIHVKLLNQLIAVIPPPQGNPEAELSRH